jgi:arsenite methyltransferase
MLNKSEAVDYGIDAPGLVKFFFLGGLFVGLVSILANLYWISPSFWQKTVQIGSIIVSGYSLGMGCLMVYWSKIGKLRERDQVISQIPWTGSERVLDVGCGRGLMLIAAAHKLSSGQAIGIDTWQAKDQFSNSSAATINNARIENVAKKVSIQTADMRTLPFEANSFDLIVSHWVVHNLPKKEERQLTLKEMVRVLRPGGLIVLSDIENRNEYLQQFKALGINDCRMLINSFEDIALGIVSFGSFRPISIFATKPI